ATPTTPPGTEYIGDVNSNGSIDIVDALLVAQYYVGLDPANFNASNADANCNGNVDIVDALLIARYYVGLIAEFC
ncbi:MAG: dockerin type I repeat-containing protein, partial [Spirochaetales bacterium]|nr:dockerin type I repeat-containing protein [Spirochaetales bacterium]